MNITRLLVPVFIICAASVSACSVVYESGGAMALAFAPWLLLALSLTMNILLIFKR